MTEEQSEALDEATGYYLQDNLADALDLTGILLSDHPDWPEVLLLRGKVLFELDRKIEAAHTLRRCVEVDPANAEAFYALGLTFRHLRTFEDAAGCLQAALRRDPADDDARFVLANVCYAQGQLDEAIALYQALIQRQPGWADAHFNLAKAAEEAGQTALAHEAQQRFLSLSPAGPGVNEA